MGHKLFPGKIIFFFICSRVSLSPAPEPPPTGCCCFPGYTGRAGACEPHLVPHFWSLGEVGGREPPGRVPPSPGLCLHARLPAVYSPVPFPGVAQRGPPGYQVGTGGLEQPGGDTVGGVTNGLFLLVASPRAILRVGLSACGSFVTLIPATGGLWRGGMRCGGTHRLLTPSCPTLGVSLCQIRPPRPPTPKTPQPCPCRGCGDTVPVPMWLWGSASLLLGIWGHFGPPHPRLSCGTCVAGGGSAALALSLLAGAVVSLVEPPPPTSSCFFCFCFW